MDLSDGQKFVYMLKQPICNLIKYITLAWNLRKSKLLYKIIIWFCNFTDTVLIYSFIFKVTYKPMWAG